MSPVDDNVTQVRQHNDKSSLKISTKLCTHNRTTFTVTSSCMCVRSAYYNKDELYRLRDCFLTGVFINLLFGIFSTTSVGQHVQAVIGVV